MSNRCAAYAGIPPERLFTMASSRLGVSKTLNPRMEHTIEYPVVHPQELLVDMDYKGVGAKGANALGWERDIGAYFERLYESDPSLFKGQNLANVTDELGGFKWQGPVRVDEEWISRFSQYAPYRGDTLVHHHVGEGAQAVAVPQREHAGHGHIHNFEREAGVIDNARMYSDYVKDRVERGESYDALAFRHDYEEERGITAPDTSQRLVQGMVDHERSSHITKGETNDLSVIEWDEPAKAQTGIGYCSDSWGNMYLTPGTELVQMRYDSADRPGCYFMPRETYESFKDETGVLDCKDAQEGLQIGLKHTDDGVHRCSVANAYTVGDDDLLVYYSEAKENPQYGAGGKQQYFISDPEGAVKSGALVRHGPLDDPEKNTMATEQEWTHQQNGAAIQDMKKDHIQYQRQRRDMNEHPSALTEDADRAKASLDDEIQASRESISRMEEQHGMLERTSLDRQMEYQDSILNAEAAEEDYTNMIDMRLDNRINQNGINESLSASYSNKHESTPMDAITPKESKAPEPTAMESTAPNKSHATAQSPMESIAPQGLPAPQSSPMEHTVTQSQ